MSAAPLSSRRMTLRRRVLLGFWVLTSVVLVARAGQLQILQGDTWREAADGQQRGTATLPAPRGSILDRDRVPLAVSHETFTVGVAPHELKDRDAAATALSSALALSDREARSITRSDRRWVPIRGRFPAMVREALDGVQGIYVERELDRFYPHGDLARGVLGRIQDDTGRGGVEQHFDSLLMGFAGRAVDARDSRGRPIPGQTWIVEEPRSGGQVVLTLDLELQEIAEEALAEAVAETEAAGGTVLVTEPRTGEILAMASVRDGSPNSLAAINTPYEPGSTLKPFTVATLLKHGVAELGDSVDTEEGSWRIHGRTLRDVHAEGKITLADALRVSSNVGIAKMAQGLSAAQQYEALRDFGFGVPTGIPLSGEAPGTLRRPSQWSRQSPASLAIGYEIAVTPIQMAMAYGALANGGSLMEPRLVKEVRDADGQVLDRFEPRVVRRVLPGWLTRVVNEVLVDVVEDGTGTAARLATFDVAGKSGTSRIWSPSGGYERGAYFSSFVGFFPADEPQLVVYVMLERPKGAYYGGAIAAPVTGATLEAILAARRPPLDRSALARLAANPRRAVADPLSDVRFASADLTGVRRAAGDEWQSRSPGDKASAVTVRLEDLADLPVREAVRRLHARGLRVTWDGGGLVRRTVPKPGAVVVPGDTIHLTAERAQDD